MSDFKQIPYEWGRNKFQHDPEFKVGDYVTRKDSKLIQRRK